MGLARQSVQRTVDLLAAEGLVTYADNPAHRRAKLVRLTQGGEALLAAIAPRQAAGVEGLVAALDVDAEQIQRPCNLLARLRIELEQVPIPPLAANER